MAKVVKVDIRYFPDNEPPDASADFYSPGLGGFYTRDVENTGFTLDAAGVEALETMLNGTYPENEGA